MIFEDLIATIFVKRWRDAVVALQAFLLFDTKALITCSAVGDAAHRRNLSILLGACAVASQAFLLSTFGSAGEFDSALKPALASTAIVLLLLSPFLIAHSLMSDGTGAYQFVVNTIFIQQVALAVLLALASVVYYEAEPAGTEFRLLDQGIGEGTVAYKYTCNLMQDVARVAYFNRRTAARNDALLHDLRTLKKWIETGRDPTLLMPVQVPRREREASEGIRDGIELVEIGQRRQQIQKEFADRYPNTTVADVMREISLPLLGFIAAFHLIRGLFLRTRSHRRPLVAVVALLAWLSTGALTLLLNSATTYQPTVSLPSSDNVEAKTLGALQSEQNAFKIAMRKSEFQLRELYYENRSRCPGIGNYGLWK